MQDDHVVAAFQWVLLAQVGGVDHTPALGGGTGDAEDVQNDLGFALVHRGEAIDANLTCNEPQAQRGKALVCLHPQAFDVTWSEVDRGFWTVVDGDAQHQAAFGAVF